MLSAATYNKEVDGASKEKIYELINKIKIVFACNITNSFNLFVNHVNDIQGNQCA